jgi:oligopeptide/dipeptide ABC transporter ATP-binding protein
VRRMTSVGESQGLELDPPTKSLLDVQGAAIAIRSREVASDISFALARGECLGIVGETGSGKSVTCRMLTGMLGVIGGSATRGTALFDGIDLLSLSERDWRRLRGRRIGLIPQSALSSLDPVMRVGDQLIETVRELRPEANSRHEALALMEQVQMPRAREVLRLFPHQLSGGMKQRVMIALGLAGRPDLLVADEPTTALDVTVQREILDLLKRLRVENAMSMIFVSHDLGVVSAISETVAIMYAGTTVEIGSTAEVVREPKHPYTKALLDARPSLAGSGARLRAIAGMPPEPASWPTGCRFAPRCAFAQDRCRASLPPLDLLGVHRRVRCLRAAEIRL